MTIGEPIHLAQPFEVCQPGRASAILISVDLFSPQQEENSLPGPLADRMRPRSLEELVGQDDVLGPGRPLRLAIEHDTLSSLILWGPPGSGKTSLGRLIAAHTKAQFEPFSAVTSGIPELRQVVKTAEQRRIVKGQRTILFVDEIHRFNKAQQDAFLPHVESGTVILIGATTENPSFEVISPLLSRSLVVVLQALSENALSQIIERALRDPERGLGRYHVEMDVEAMMSLVAFANGDARVALNALEFAVLHTAPGPDGDIHMSKGALATALQKKSLRYDKGGEEHGNLPVPLHLRNAPTELMKELGYGKGYRYVHEDPAARTEQTHLPEKLAKKQYYRPKKSDKS